MTAKRFLYGISLIIQVVWMFLIIWMGTHAVALYVRSFW